MDYELVYGIRDLVTQSVSPISEHVRRFLETIQSLSSSGIDLTREQVRMQMNVSEPTIKRYVRTARESDFIETEGKGKRQMLKLIDIPEPASPLPKPETVFLPRDPVIQNDKVRDIQDFGPDHGSMIHRDPNDPSPGNEETITDQTGSNGSDRSTPYPQRERWNRINGSLASIEDIDMDCRQLIEAIKKYGVRAKGRKELFAHVRGKKLPRGAAIFAKCFDCMGYYADGKVDCHIPNCPLYNYMPYRDEHEP